MAYKTRRVYCTECHTGRVLPLKGRPFCRLCGERLPLDTGEAQLPAPTRDSIELDTLDFTSRPKALTVRALEGYLQSADARAQIQVLVPDDVGFQTLTFVGYDKERMVLTLRLHEAYETEIIPTNLRVKSPEQARKATAARARTRAKAKARQQGEF